MIKITWLLLPLLLPWLLAAEEKPEWKKTVEPSKTVQKADTEGLPTVLAERYYLQLAGKNCAVNVLKDNKGLIIAANSIERVLLFSARPIHINEGAYILPGIGLTNMHHFSRENGDDPTWIIPERNAPHLFQQFCAEHAKRLPPEVRKKFQGEFGVR